MMVHYTKWLAWQCLTKALLFFLLICYVAGFSVRFGHGSIFPLIMIVACLISSVGSFPRPVDWLGPCILGFRLNSCQKSQRYGSFHTDVCAFALKIFWLLLLETSAAALLMKHGLFYLLRMPTVRLCTCVPSTPVYREGVLCEPFSVLHW